MANQKQDTIDFAGDYNLDNVFLHNHLGEITDIKGVMIELNIFESIYSNALTGSIVIADAQNLIGKLQINGTERIAFTLSTPGTSDKRSIVDASVETGHPFHIYKITDRRQINQGSLVYTLHFGSREFMRNLRTKVSQAYDGRLDMSVLQILTDEDYLDSKKQISFEPCGNSDKIVIPNMRPFDAINMIANKALPEKSDGVGYYFYETTKGFHFRSWENMVVSEGNFNRPTKQEFYYMPLNIDDPNIDNKIEHEYKSVESYRFVNNFHDVAANTVGGTYGHRVITHNLFDKSYREDDYNYHLQFPSTEHTDKGYNYAIGESDVDETPMNLVDSTSKVSDYPESRVSLQSTTRFLHNEDKGSVYGLDVLQDGPKLGQGISQQAQVVQGTALKLVVKGQSYLEAGDLIEFKLRSVDEKNTDGEEDPLYSGRYVITKIRHQINAEKYVMVLECAKDSVKSSFSRSDFKIPKNSNIATLRDTYSVESGFADGSS